MKKIAFLLLLILLNISAYAQEEGISDIETKQVVATEQLQSKDFSFASMSFELDCSKNYTKTSGFTRFADLYFQDSNEYSDNDFFSVGVKKQPIQEFNLNTYNYTVKDYADGFSLGKWNNKKGFNMDISLGGKCGL